MNHRWISKLRERELYYRVKDDIGTLRTFLVGKLGYRIIENNNIIKLEKLPGEAQPWMGIQDFSDVAEYALFCVVLMFLEDKEVEEQFVLSQLTEYISSHFPEGQISWTVFANRQKLIRVIKYCIKNDLFLIDDGNMESFAADLETEALYENTGYSKYFTRTFTRDIQNYSHIEEFFQSDWVDMDQDRGVVRRQRVYRKLLLSLGMYRERELDEDFNYVKQYRSILENDFEKLVDCSLQVHKSSAYLIIGENGNLGKVFPGKNSLSDAVLMLHYDLRNLVEQGKLNLAVNERIVLPIEELKNIITQLKRNYEKGFSKAYREMSDVEFVNSLFVELERLSSIQINEITQEVEIMPIIGKITGGYPKNFKEEK